MLLFFNPKLAEADDLSPNAFLTLLAAVEVNERCNPPEFELTLAIVAEVGEELAAEERVLPEEVRQAATKIS